jgi:hypothetical protein
VLLFPLLTSDPDALYAKPPAVSVAVPEGVVPPAGELATVTVTLKVLFEFMVENWGVTVTVDAVLPLMAGQAWTTL